MQDDTVHAIKQVITNDKWKQAIMYCQYGGVNPNRVIREEKKAFFET